MLNMGIICRIAWRNLWRNPRRSMILISAVVVCIAGLVFTLSYINGILSQMVRSSIDFHTGELEVYRKGFIEDHDPVNHIKAPEEILSFLGTLKGVKAFAPRVEGRGLISSSYSSSGVQIVGIEPSMEGDITLVKRSVVEGEYLPSGSERKIMIGRKMANKLKVGIGNKVVLTLQTVKEELASDVYRVVGVFETISSDFDKYMVYIPIEMARKLLEIDSGVTGIAVRTHNMDSIPAVQVAINERFGSQEVEALTWGEIDPAVEEMVKISKQWNLIFFLAIFIILSIGIINTQNIAVYERMHELGVIKAMGTRPLSIFLMVMMETLFLGLVGLLVGFLLTYPIMIYFSIKGLNLAMFSEGLEMFGLASRIYFDIVFEDVVYSALSVLITSFIGAIIPAIKASRLEPVKAMRYV